MLVISYSSSLMFLIGIQYLAFIVSDTLRS